MRQLPGVGDYIAAAVLSIAFAKPHAVVDGNVKRVLARLFVMATPVNLSTAHKVFQAVADQLLDTEYPGRHNQAMMEMGAEVCVPRQPLCSHCPLAHFCQAQLTRTTDQYPARVQRRAVGRQHWVAGAVVRQGRLLLTRRPETGLLGGLWELPGGVVREGEAPVRACADRIREVVGLDVGVARHLVTVNHAYTHFKLRLDIYLCGQPEGRVRRNGPSAHEWVSLERLGRLPLHKAVHKALPVIREILG
jgi:A/G-specific adenine glycosylase